jgi:hypothetical protein
VRQSAAEQDENCPRADEANKAVVHCRLLLKGARRDSILRIPVRAVIPRRFDGNITLSPEELSNLSRHFMHLAVENVIMQAIDGGIKDD